MIVQDDRGRELDLPGRPNRIVSLVPSISETLWHLGVGERLVAVTRYCTDPPEVKLLPRCGGTKNPDCDAIEALAPDLVFVSEEENRREDYDRLVAAGLSVFVCFPRRLADLSDWVRRVGAAVDCPAAADQLAQDIQAALRQAAEAVEKGGVRPRVFCPIWKKPWMSFNADTWTHAMIDASGGDNIFAGAQVRYCKVSLEEAARREPDLILLPDEPYPFSRRDLADLQMLLYPAGSARRALVVDGQALSWYGARTPRGLGVLRQAVMGGNG